MLTTACMNLPGRQNSRALAEKRIYRQPYHPPFYAYERGGEPAHQCHTVCTGRQNQYMHSRPPLVPWCSTIVKNTSRAMPILTGTTALFMPPWILLRPTRAAGRPATIAAIGIVSFVSAGLGSGLTLRRIDYRFLYQYMSELPRESAWPHYDTTEYFDSYAKFFLFKAARPGYLLIYGCSTRPGWTYGFLTDVAYVV